ncbi:MAG: NAD(P)H-hydrate dehydratase [Bdellovibrionales bacterium]
MTPHTAELSQNVDKTVGQIEADRYLSALLGSERTGCHLLLKGFRSVLAYQHRTMVINSSNSALAKAGTGDVLTGMIAGLLAQNVEPVQATATASYIHGRMADEWVRSGHDRRSLTASDLRDHLPTLMSRLSHGAIV